MSIGVTERDRPSLSDPLQHAQQDESHGAGVITASTVIEQVARFTVLRSSEPMGKRVWVEGGEVRAQFLDPRTYYEHHPVEVSTIEDLAEAFRRASEWEIFISGTSDAADGETVRRSQDGFPLAAGPGAMFVDNDTHPGGDQFSALYVKACPALSSASYVHAPSSGAYIYDEAEAQLVGAKGQHYAIPVLDARDITRALKTLHKRCILAGFGVAAVHENGNVKVKSPVDVAMATSNQPLFQRVTAEGGLKQDKVPHIHAHRGEVFMLDTLQAIPDLSAREQAALAAIEKDLHLSVAEEAARVKAQYIAVHSPQMAEANGWSQARAVAELEKSLKQSGNSAARGPQVDLWAGMKINFTKLGLVDVADVLTDPDRFHGQTCDDPMEPSYKPGSGVAKCYTKDKAGRHHDHPGIHSFAHNSRTVYHLKCDLSHIDFEPGIKKLTQEAKEARKASDVGEPVEPSTGPVERAVEGLYGDLAGFQILDMSSGRRATEFVIDGFLPNGVTVIAGEPGAGKTTNLVPMAACAAHLSPAAWGFHSKRRRAVIWLSEHPDQVFDTIEALLQLEGSASREEFAQWFKVLPTKRSSPEELASLITAANARFSWTNDRGVVVHPLIVWDTAAATIDVENENDNALISKVIALAKQTLGGGALWVIAHTPKASSGATDVAQMSARGAGAYGADGNCTAFLIQDRDGRRVLALGKIRFTAAFPEIHFDSARHTETIVDHFDGQELDKTVVCGLPSPGSKQDRQQAKIDIHRLAQRDAVLQVAVSAAAAGTLCGLNDLYQRRTISMKKEAFNEMVNGMLGDGVLNRVHIPQNVRQELKLNGNKTDAILPASVNPADVFARVMEVSVGSQPTGNRRADSVKSEGDAE